VDARVRNKIDLEFVDIDVQSSFETKRGSKGADYLSNQSVQVGVSRLLETQVIAADVVDSLIVEHKGNIGVFKQRVSGEDGVVGLNNAVGDLRGGEDTEVQLALLAVIDRESFKEEGTKARACTTANRVEDEESLETIAVLSELPDLIQDSIDVLLTNSVVTTSVVVGGVLLASDHLIRVEELRIFAGLDLIDYGGLQIEVDASWYVFASTSFAEKGVEGNRPVGGLLGLVKASVGVDAMLKAVEFPAGGTNLDTSLTNVEGDDFAHSVLMCCLTMKSTGTGRVFLVMRNGG